MCVCVCVCVCTHHGILLGHKEILPFVTTWINLADIMLSEINQRKTHTYHLNVESKNSTNY